jgi:valyl-tRNA synthetase
MRRGCRITPGFGHRWKCLIARPDPARSDPALSRAEAKLANPSFVDRAPTAVVEKERAKVTDQRRALESLKNQRVRLETLGTK